MIKTFFRKAWLLYKKKPAVRVPVLSEQMTEMQARVTVACKQQASQARTSKQSSNQQQQLGCNNSCCSIIVFAISSADGCYLAFGHTSHPHGKSDSDHGG